MKKIKELSTAKKVWLTIVLIPVVIVAVLSGCNNSLHVKFPDNPIKFETYGFTNPYNSEDTTLYGAFDYNGRTYISYAYFDKTLYPSDVGDCLGYIVQDGEERKNDWIVQLKAFPNEEVLMLYSPDDTMMGQPSFYRAIDTRGHILQLPDYISESNDEAYWKE